MAAEQAFLIDGTAFCYRAFYAIRAPMSTADGRPTNAVFGFAMMLKSLRDKHRPAYLAVAFDTGKPTFRHKKFKGYKVSRKPTPPELIQQVPVVKQLLAAYRIPCFEREGYEAEDLLATIARRIAGPDLDVLLVTGDKDALQLIDRHIKVFNPHQENGLVEADAVRERYGVEPSQMVDLMALMGDKIDDIPGVPGIGPKTAAQLIHRFGSLNALYRRLKDVESPSQRKHLEEKRDQAELSRELAQIDSDAPIEVSAKALKIQEPDWKALRALLRELDFKRMLNQVEERTPADAPEPGAAHAVESDAGVDALVKRLRAHRGATALAAWPAGNPADAAFVALAFGKDEAWVARIDRTVLRSAAGKRLAVWLADPEAAKVGHDAKSTARWLSRLGAPLDGVRGDTMLAAYLLNPARTSPTLADLADERLGERIGAAPDPEELSGASLPQVAAVCGQHARAIAALHEQCVVELAAVDMAALYEELELPLLNVLAKMEAAGVGIDLVHLSRLKASMDSQLLHLTQEIYRLAGTSFNLNSPKQLAEVLFGRLKLPVIKRTKTGFSTDSDVLHQLAAKHPLPERLLQYRELSKLMSTYVDALPKLADPADGRIHTSFNQAATATGRLSSSEPNLQNIPIKTELGRSIRQAFIPAGPDHALVAADYSQVELRLLAHMAGDDQLIAAFRDGRDIHRYTASLIYGMPEPEIQPEQRYAAKTVNFGILYGMSAHGLSKELGIPFEDAQRFIDAYFERYPKVRGYLDGQILKARKDGFVQTLLGRRRYIPEVNSPDMMTRQFGERMAINAPVQGSAADLIKRAMVQLDRRLAKERLASRMVLQVHDELVFDAPKAEVARLTPLIRQEMEGAFTLSVPLEVTVKAGPNWLELLSVK